MELYQFLHILQYILCILQHPVDFSKPRPFWIDLAYETTHVYCCKKVAATYGKCVFIHSFTCAHWFIQWFAIFVTDSSSHPLVSSVDSSNHSFIHQLIHLIIHSFVNWLVQSFTEWVHWLVQSFSGLFKNSVSHSFIHSLFIHSPLCQGLWLC